MKAYARTDVGSKRSMNQDYMFCSEQPVGSFRNLFIVADGMGGHKAGDYASKLCVEQMVSSIRSSANVTPVTVYDEAIREANAAIYRESATHREYEGMGTTMVSCTVEENVMYVANIGDSRLYLFREHLEQITDDHSLVEELVKNGNLTEREARIHPQKNIITRALGTDEEVMADYFEVKVQQGDRILLCSDGLSNMLDREDLEYILDHYDNLEEAGDDLIRQANANGGEDNITVVLAEIS